MSRFNTASCGNREHSESFAAWLQDDDKILQSSSGGTFTGLAEKAIAENGIVFGAAYNDDLSVSQISVDNLKDLQELKGSNDKFLGKYNWEKIVANENTGTQKIKKKQLVSAYYCVR